MSRRHADAKGERPKTPGKHKTPKTQRTNRTCSTDTARGLSCASPASCASSASGVDASTLTDREKEALRAAFFAALGPNAAVFKALLEHAPELCFYMKDRERRIMALDREVLETGQPVLQRVTAHPADYSNRLMISDVYPLRDRRGRLFQRARGLTPGAYRRAHARTRT